MPDLHALPPVGYSFDEITGRLYARTDGGVTVLFPWPVLLAFSRAADSSDWTACLPERPWLGHLAPPEESSALSHAPTGVPAWDPGGQAIQRFFEGFPRSVCTLVAPFADRHWHLLRWLARAGPAAEDLCASNPALAYMVASSWEFGTAHERRVRQPAPVMLAYRKQRSILGWLGFPPAEAVRHIVRKIAPPVVSVQQLVALRPALYQPETVKKLCHVPRINPDILQLASEQGIRWVTPRVLDEICRAGDDRETTTARMLADTLRMWRQVRRGEQPPLFHSLKRIRELHDELAQEFARWRPEEEGHGADLPAPPFAGTKTIVPITSKWMLRQEGRVQHNCVASYVSQVARGRVAIYRVLEPERATLSLVRSRGRWRLQQLKGPCNANVTPATREAVRQWFEAEVAAAQQGPSQV